MALTEWVPAMRALVQWLDDEDLTTSEALCVRTVGDFTAGMVLHKLLYWMPKGSRSDGGIWKADREFASEMGLSYGQMKRARAKLKPLLVMQVKKARGAPTWHYWVEPEGLLRAISRALLRSFVFVRVWFSRCMANLQNGFSQPARMDFRRMQESITTESSTQLTTDSVSALLISYGVNKAVAETLAWVPRRVVVELAQQAATAKRPGGYLLWLLRRWVQAHPQPGTLPEETQGEDQGQRSRDSNAEAQRRREDQAQEEMALWRPEPVVPQVVERRFDDMSKPEQAWVMAKDQLERQLDRANFDTWVRSVEFKRFDMPSTLVLECRNTFARDNLQYRLYRSLCRVYRDCFGSPVEIEFVVRKAAAG